jgi:hypothetical protein
VTSIFSFSARSANVPKLPHLGYVDDCPQRGEAWGDSESRQMLEQAIEKGRGGPKSWHMMRNQEIL